jgi:hypothetical protein
MVGRPRLRRVCRPRRHADRHAGGWFILSRFLNVPVNHTPVAIMAALLVLPPVAVVRSWNGRIRLVLHVAWVAFLVDMAVFHRLFPVTGS